MLGVIGNTTTYFIPIEVLDNHIIVLNGDLLKVVIKERFDGDVLIRPTIQSVTRFAPVYALQGAFEVL